MNIFCALCDEDFLNVDQNFKFLLGCRHMICYEHGADLEEGSVIL